MGLCEKAKRPKKKRKKRPSRARKQLGRVREKVEVVSYDWTMSHIQADPSPLPEPMTENRPIYVEKMVDDNDLTQWHNPCRHEKYVEEGEILRPPNPRSILDMSIVADSAPMPDWYAKLITHIPSCSYQQLDDLGRLAMEHFRHAVKPEVKLANFLFELVTMAGKAAKVALKSVKTLKDLRKYYEWTFKSLVKQGYKEVDAHYLAWKFCVEPSIRDLIGIWCTLIKTRKRALWLIKHNGAVVRVRFSVLNFNQIPLEELVITAGKPGGYYYGPWNPLCPPWQGGCASPEREEIAGNYLWIPKKVQFDYHAQANVIYRIPPGRLIPPDLDDPWSWLTSGELKVWAASLGMDRVGSFIWEALPFSFMVDWFTDLGKQGAAMLDELTQLFPDGEILEAGHSVKLTSEWDAVYDIEGEPELGNHLGSASYTYYVRKKGLLYPGLTGSVPFSFDSGGLSHGERPLLTLALVTQAIKRYKRRGRG